MTREFVDNYIMTHDKYFPSDKIQFLRDKLLSLDEEKAKMLCCIELKDPTEILLYSFALGAFGADRFLLGDVGLGVLKLLTAGCCGVLYLVDLFIIRNRTKEKNFEQLWKAIA